MEKLCKILIVDDNQSDVGILEGIFEEGFVLETASSGHAALKKAAEFLPDIILLDVMMPDMNGYEVCKRLRHMPEQRFTKIIMISAQALSKERVEGYNAGADDYIVKPFDDEDVYAKVRVFTQLKYAEEDERGLREALEKSRKAEQLKGQFLANMSHEIRTPLNIILGYSQVLLDEQGLQDEYMGYIKHIHNNGEHLLRLINDILDFSKIEAGKVDMEIREFCLDEMLDELKGDFTSIAADKGIDFSVINGCQKPLRMQTDSFRLKQCLINLINNAIKFTDEGSVHLSVVLPDRNTIQFDVIDTGVGIAAEKINDICDPFSQEDGTIARKFGGTGLGISITKNLSRLLGGHLSLQSEKDKGSVFSIVVPIRLGGVEAGEPHSDPYNSDTQLFSDDLEGKVLIVEDIPCNQQIVIDLLKKRNLVYRVASNGYEAISYLLQEPFDLIIMDAQMPELDGLETTRQIRAAGMEVPIIALTANVLKQQREDFFTAGCTEFLPKPLVVEDFYETISKFLPHHSPS